MLRRLAVFLFLLLAFLGGAFLWLRSSVTPLSGTLAVAGLSAPVTAERDAAGVPTIKAANTNDAAFALGFLHAEDRLFQMDLMRRFAGGRLSEWFGSRALPTDQQMRTLGLYRAGARQFDILSPDIQSALKAYADGVNAFLASRRGALPPEYYALNATPEPWTPADTLSWGKIMALQLSGNYRGKLFRSFLARTLNPDDMQVLFPEYPKDGPRAISQSADLLKRFDLGRLYASLPSAVGLHYASNNWVVDGAHSASGKPLLANDPHLGFQAPGTWYLARLMLPGLTLSGATAPGVPLFVIGHNDRIAWGFTTTAADVEDLFVEKLDPDDPQRYATPDGTAAFDVRVETIKVRGGEPVELKIRSTRHGPVISDLGGSAAAPEGRVLALEANFLEDGDRTPEALWKMNKATDWQSFQTALRDFGAPEQNMVYADVEGHIGFASPGRLPIRAKGDNEVPVPGWTGEYDWTGWVPFEEMPAQLDPPTGRVVTANNKIVPDDYPHFITRDWDIPNRAIRIGQLLDETRLQTPDSSAAMQADTLSLMAKDLLPLMLRIEPPNDRAKAAMDRLRAWDGHMDGKAPEPLIFMAWLRDFDRAILATKLDGAGGDYGNLRVTVAHEFLSRETSWCDRKACDEALAASLDRTLTELATSYGTDMASWRWDGPHRAAFDHPFFALVPVLRNLVHLEVPTDGGYDTVNRGATPIWSPDRPYADVLGPGLRMIVDMAAPDKARFLMTPGQSGNPLSPHYGDFMQPWHDFRWQTLGGPAIQHLTLAPQ